ncbi:MAG: hypothetical protein LBV72_18280 [Tannerella sp.]|jgi:hypothetical protein|nr:hypothetical protein [Tannerella sp.]
MKYFICALSLLLFLGCDDELTTSSREFLIKKGTVFVVNQKQGASDYLPLSRFEITNDTIVNGKEYKKSDLLYKISWMFVIDTFWVGDFSIYSQNDTFYIKEPIYSIYTNTRISQDKNATRIIFDMNDPIHNPPLRGFDLFEDIFVTIDGEIDVIK